MKNFKKIYIDIKSKLQIHLFKKGVYISKYNNKVAISKLLFKDSVELLAIKVL